MLDRSHVGPTSSCCEMGTCCRLSLCRFHRYIYACVLACSTCVASRLDEETKLDDVADLSGRPARVTEKFSPAEMQGQLLKFLKNSRVHGWPQIKDPNRKERQFMSEAVGIVNPTVCEEWPGKRIEIRDAEALAANFETLSIRAAQAHDERRAAQKEAKKFGSKKARKEAEKAKIRASEADRARAKADHKRRTSEVKEVSTKSDCEVQVGCLAQSLTDACQRTEMQPTGKGRSIHLKDPWTACSKSVNDIFFHGSNVVRAWQVGCYVGSAPNETNPLCTKGDFLKPWIIPLATPVKAGILWAGFWTDASDLEGRSRTSKESLKHFADLIETQTVHPSTHLGRRVEDYDNLADCHDHVVNGLKVNMWSLFSFSFVAGMREKMQDMVVVLVNKKLEGERKLSDSVLSAYELPSIGITAWGLGFWSPQVVVIDFFGNCRNTGPVLRKRLFSRLALSSKEAKLDVQDFVRRSKLSWTCLDCPEPRCKLDRFLAEQAKDILQAKRKQDEKGTALMKAVKEGEVADVQKLLQKGADVNFQDHEGNTALFLAAKGGDMAKAKLLLKHGAYVDARNFQGKTPLFKATPEIGKVLLDNGANRTARSLKGKTAKVLEEI